MTEDANREDSMMARANPGRAGAGFSNIDLGAASTAAGGSPALRGYLVRPAGDGPFPAVLMIHEAFGLDENTVRHADRLAASGYVTLAVDLYSDGGARRCLVATMRSLAAGAGRAFTDLAAARAWLLESGQTTGKIGVIGFCMGGGFALLIAHDGFDAAAVNYGKIPKDPGVLAGSCPIVANFGGRDRTLPEAADKLAAALDGLGVEHDIQEFAAAGHASSTRCRWAQDCCVRCIGSWASGRIRNRHRKPGSGSTTISPVT